MLSSEEVLQLPEVPARVVVIGGGAIGCEFASFFVDAGSEVTILEALPQILSGVDQQVAQTVVRAFQKRGIKTHTGVKVLGFDGTAVRFEAKNGEEQLPVDKVVVSVGRRPRSENVGLDGAGVKVDERGFVVVDGNMRTNVEGVYAAGDVVATPQLAHVAFSEAVVAIKTMLGESPIPLDYDKVPWGIYCHPEVAFCGLTEAQAKERGYDVETSVAPVDGQRPRLDRRRDRRDGEDRRRTRRRDPRRAHRRPVGDRAHRRGLSQRQLGGDPRRCGTVDPRPSDVVGVVRRIRAGPHGAFSARVEVEGRHPEELMDVTMPQLGETVTEGTITKWFKQVGEPIAADEPLFEVSTDKVDSEVPAPQAGFVTEIVVQEGETVPVGARLAVISEQAGGGGAPAAAPAETPAPAAAPEPAAAAPAAAPAPAATPPPAPPATPQPAPAAPAPPRSRPPPRRHRRPRPRRTAAEP